MQVYHGSKNLFEVFDYNKIGENGTTEGKGFYFTDKLSIAKGYGQSGYLYTVELEGRKGLSSKNKEITRDELRKYLLEMNSLNQYLSNWGDVLYSGLDSVVDDAVSGEYDASDNDVDMISAIAHASGNIEDALRLLNRMFGYDSITVNDAKWGSDHTVYIALVPEVIKIINIEKL